MMILCGHSKKSLRWLRSHLCPHLVNFPSQLPISGQCVCRWTSNQLLSTVSPYLCYVFVKRPCNNLPLYATSPGSLYWYSNKCHSFVACFRLSQASSWVFCVAYVMGGVKDDYVRHGWCSRRLCTSWVV